MLTTGYETGDDMTKVAYPGNRFDNANLLLGEQLHRAMTAGLRTPDRGFKRARLAVLRTLDCPGALVECAFLSNDAEARRVATPEFRQLIAESLATGVQDYAATLAALRPAPVPPPAPEAITPKSSGQSCFDRPHQTVSLLSMFTSVHPRHLLLSCACLALLVTARAWDYEGHRMVNQLGLASLPKDFPAFVQTPANAERIAFLAGEPDRWRNVPDLPIKQYNGMDHYLDVEQLADAGIDATKVTSFRYDFAVQFAAGRLAHPDKFAAIDAEKNAEHSREWPGFAPWAITEYYGKLKSAFSYLKAFQESGTPEEVANAQANILYTMGVMGHYVGDCAQPLHTTIHHNGWVGPNPNNYTKWSGIHGWIDGGFIGKAGIKTADMLPRVTPAAALALPAQPDGRDPAFVAVMTYFLAQNQLVEPLYALEKKGVFKSDIAANSPEGRKFIEDRLLTGGGMLASIWVTAWKQAAPDVFLRAQLLRRSGGTPDPKPRKSKKS